jgi:hypothetical protein
VNQLTLSGSEPRTLGGIPLVDYPPGGDEAALVGALAQIIAELCAVNAPDALRRPMQRLEAA